MIQSSCGTHLAFHKYFFIMVRNRDLRGLKHNFMNFLVSITLLTISINNIVRDAHAFAAFAAILYFLYLYAQLL